TICDLSSLIVNASPINFISSLCYSHLPVLFLFSFFLITRPPPKSTLFPYTTLFRSLPRDREKGLVLDDVITIEDEPAEKWTEPTDRKSTRLNSSHQIISYAVFCLKKKKTKKKKTK